MRSDRRDGCRPLGIALAVGMAACTSPRASPEPMTSPEAGATLSPEAGTIALPTLSLAAGDAYFTVDGTQRCVMSRNITGETVAAIDALLDQASAAGTSLVRIHVIQGLGPGVTSAGTVDETWAASWDAVFDHASRVGLYVAPVFDVWADWNDGTPDEGFSYWSMNPWNAANGGPASDPSELWQDGTPVRTAWLAWLAALVQRWQVRPNIAAWEVFSELDLATGVTESSGAAFVAAASAVVRDADAQSRPVMASLSALADSAPDGWAPLLSSDAIDIVQVHPYAAPGTAPLDLLLVNAVLAKLTYGKPVLIGESGLSAAAPDGTTATTEPNADVAIRHAIWAGVVSGAMNARALWWEDGYAIYEPPGLAFVDSYAHAETPAARLAGTVDLAGARPLVMAPSPGVVGSAVGSEVLAVGWLRSESCEAPAWDCATPLASASVALTIPGTGTAWSIDYYDTTTGGPLAGVAPVAPTRSGSTVTVSLPSFADDLAFVIRPISP
jgi:hypothetical protein